MLRNNKIIAFISLIYSGKVTEPTSRFYSEETKQQLNLFDQCWAFVGGIDNLKKIGFSIPEGIKIEEIRKKLDNEDVLKFWEHYRATNNAKQYPEWNILYLRICFCLDYILRNLLFELPNAAERAETIWTWLYAFFDNDLDNLNALIASEAFQSFLANCAENNIGELPGLGGNNNTKADKSFEILRQKLRDREAVLSACSRLSVIFH